MIEAVGKHYCVESVGLGSEDGDLAGIQARSRHGLHDPAEFTDGIFRSQKLILEHLTIVKAKCSWCWGLVTPQSLLERDGALK